VALIGRLQFNSTAKTSLLRRYANERSKSLFRKKPTPSLANLAVCAFAGSREKERKNVKEKPKSGVATSCKVRKPK
jgi:hypothetical protein